MEVSGLQTYFLVVGITLLVLAVALFTGDCRPLYTGFRLLDGSWITKLEP